MPPISFGDLLSHLRATHQGVAVEQWTELQEAVLAYDNKSIDKKKATDKFKEVVGNDALKAAVIALHKPGAAAAAAGAAAAASPDPSAAPAPAAAKRQAAGAGLEAQPRAKRARMGEPAAASVDGYAEAAAEPADADADARGGKRAEVQQDKLQQDFDVLQASGVDLDQEEEAGALPAPAEESGAAAAEPRLGPVLTSEGAVREKLDELVQQCGLSGADDGAATLLVRALEDRVTGMLGSLRPIAWQRGNAGQELLGPRAFRVSSDPTKTWKRQQARRP